MKRKVLVVALGMLGCALGLKAQQEQYLVAGCGLDKAAIINRSGEILWETPVAGSDCNDAEMTKEGNILMAYGRGAKLVTLDQQTLWDYKVEKPEEMHGATQLKNGNYLLACCGQPARIIELSPKGEVVKEFSYDTGIQNIHSQFRQVSKTSKGTYLIPLFRTSTVVEVNDRGELLREVKAEGNPFQVTVLKNKNWLVACGDGHSLIEVNPQTGQVANRVGERDLEFCKFQFVAETRRLKNGNTLVVNWNGHDREDKKQPILLEYDKNKKQVWCLYETPQLKRISTVCPLTIPFVPSGK